MAKEGKEKPSLKVSRCILLIGFVGYYLMGAKIFEALETDIHIELRNSFIIAKSSLLNHYVNITEEELDIFLQKLAYSVKYGIIPVINGTNYISWEFTNALSFVTSTLSTIGYGTIAPRTPMGQIFCVLYALLGIPLTIIFLKFVGKAISKPFSGLRNYLQSIEMKERQIKMCILLFFLVTGLLIFILLPPLIFMYMEGWSYNEGVYFAFVTLSTIGFGDYILGIDASQKYSPIYPVLILVWCAFGLSWIALLFHLFSKLLEKTKTKFTSKLLMLKKKNITYE